MLVIQHLSKLLWSHKFLVPSATCNVSNDSLLSHYASHHTSDYSSWTGLPLRCLKKCISVLPTASSQRNQANRGNSLPLSLRRTTSNFIFLSAWISVTNTIHQQKVFSSSHVTFYLFLTCLVGHPSPWHFSQPGAVVPCLISKVTELSRLEKTFRMTKYNCPHDLLSPPTKPYIT